jgi:heme exporter protein C
MADRSSSRSAGVPTWFVVVLAVALIGFLAIPFAILGAPLESTMGLVQKIFYFHVPCAFVLMTSCFVCAGGSVAYLFRGSERGDRLALAAAELGVLFGLCVLVSGPLWARVAWGVYWTWEARLTTSLLMWLVLVAYLLARRYGGPGARKLSAALGLFAAANVPLVYVSVNIWRTMHPKTTVVRTLPAEMYRVLWPSVALRTGVERERARLAELRLDVEDALEEAR